MADNVTPFHRPGRPRPVRTILECECGEQWFNAQVTFTFTSEGHWRPDSYALADKENKSAVACTSCGQTVVLH